MNLPNKLTMLRILLVPIFIACFYLDELLPGMWNYIAAVVLLAAALTDIVDGKIARHYGLVTNFGKLMDPIADKLLFCSAFVMLTGIGWLPPILTVIFIGREFVISGFRLVATNQGKVIAANWLGKAKTLLQAIGCVLMLLENPVFRQFGFRFDLFIMILAALFSVWSCADYIIKNKGAIELS